MNPAILKLLNFTFIGPLLLKVARDKKLTQADRAIIRLVGLSTLVFNGYYLYNLYQQNKLTAEQLIKQ